VFPYSDSSAHFLAYLVPFNGTVAVYTFFVISGFSLSISYVRHGDPVALSRIAVSRYPRLVIPILAASALVCLMMVIGTIPAPDQRISPLNTVLRFDPDFLHVFRFALFDVFFRFSESTAFIIPLWTMSIELAGSFLIVILLALFGRYERRVAIYAVLFLILGMMVSVYSLFVGGLILAEMSQRWAQQSRLLKTVMIGIFCVGWSAPLLADHKPSFFYLAAVAGMCAAALWVPQIRAFYESPISRFLGHISFPLYLVHGPVLYSFSLWVLATVTPYGWDRSVNHLVVGSLTIPFAVSVAVVFAPINDFAIALSRKFGAFIVRWGKTLMMRLATERYPVRADV
jgi:peptidoglycan/LPS O-acetylase OafA/YrhL